MKGAGEQWNGSQTELPYCSDKGAGRRGEEGGGGDTPAAAAGATAATGRSSGEKRKESWISKASPASRLAIRGHLRTRVRSQRRENGRPTRTRSRRAYAVQRQQMRLFMRLDEHEKEMKKSAFLNVDVCSLWERGKEKKSLMVCFVMYSSTCFHLARVIICEPQNMSYDAFLITF